MRLRQCLLLMAPLQFQIDFRIRFFCSEIFWEPFSEFNFLLTFFSLFLLFADSEVIYRNSDGHVIKFNILTNETEIVLANTTFVSRFLSFTFSIHHLSQLSVSLCLFISTRWTSMWPSILSPLTWNMFYSRMMWNRYSKSLMSTCTVTLEMYYCTFTSHCIVELTVCPCARLECNNCFLTLFWLKKFEDI